MVKRGVLVVGAIVIAVVVAFGLIGSDRNPGRSAARDVVGTGGTADGFGPLTFRAIAAAQAPMVVNIRTESRRQTRDLDEFFAGDGWLRRFFGPALPQLPQDQITEAAGSGFIIDDDGLILTNHHVVRGATKIAVALYAGKDSSEEEYEARVIGRDPLTDSALIELTTRPSHDLPVATLGDSEEVRQGDWVVAIGNPFNLAHTVTVGVISAVARPFPVSEGHWQDVLQTDAAINPGNSGGPLLNLRGEVVGINTAIITGGSAAAGNVGVGFAVPINAIRDLLPELRRGSVTRGRIGVQIEPVTRAMAGPLGLKDRGGALVRMVERGGPAADAGIEPGDVIVRYDGTPVNESDDLVSLVTNTEPGKTVPVEIFRDGNRRTVRVRVARLESADSESDLQAPLSDGGIGVGLEDLTRETSRQLQLPAGRIGTGALVTSVRPGSAAARAGIRVGDVILEVNRVRVRTAADAAAALGRIDQGDTGFVLLWRGRQELFVTVLRE
jgi:serine protease Do